MNKKLAVIIVVAAALRLWLVFTAEGVNNDTFKYVRTAQQVAAEGVVGGMQGEFMWPYYPVNRQLVFYPLLGAMVNCVVGDLVLSLRLVSAAAGVALVWGVFRACRDLLKDERIALLSAGLVAFHPEFTRASASVYREVPMAFLLVLALVFTLRAVRSERRLGAWAAAAGLTLFAAFMTRPDGAVAAAVLGLVVLFVAPGIRWRRRLSICVIMGLVFVAFEAPYVLWLKRETGHWMVSQWQIQNKMTPHEAAARHLLAGKEGAGGPHR